MGPESSVAQKTGQKKLHIVFRRRRWGSGCYSWKPVVGVPIEAVRWPARSGARALRATLAGPGNGSPSARLPSCQPPYRRFRGGGRDMLGSAGLGRGNTKNDDCRANSNARGLSEGLLCRCRRCDVVGCRVEDLMRAVVESEVKRWWACLLAAKSRRGQHANTLWDVYDTVYGVLGSWILDR